MQAPRGSGSVRRGVVAALLARLADQQEIGRERSDRSGEDQDDHRPRRAVGEPAYAGACERACPELHRSRQGRPRAGTILRDRERAGNRVRGHHGQQRQHHKQRNRNAGDAAKSADAGRQQNEAAGGADEARDAQELIGATPHHDAAVDERRRDHAEHVHAEQEAVILRRHAEIFDVDERRAGDECEQTAKIEVEQTT